MTPIPGLDKCGFADTDGDGVNDLCDEDDDGDGVSDAAPDNCRTVANADQKNTDGAPDGGDACDTDDDNDLVPDTTDNCPTASNADQADLDQDTRGDACDSDTDGDGMPNVVTACGNYFAPACPNIYGVWTNCTDDLGGNCGGLSSLDLDCTMDPVHSGYKCDGAIPADLCPTVAETGYLDFDRDSTGDGCDPDKDGDGVSNADEQVAGTNPLSNDSDGDGVSDKDDTCPAAAGAQTDTDTDGVGDLCDGDDDNDGVPDASDAFPLDSNEVGDADGDGVGNAADGDDDNDGAIDGADNCPSKANADQADADKDGRGDACDESPAPPVTPKNEPPVLTLAVARTQKLRAVLSRGLRFTASCDKRCTVAGQVLLDAKTAKRLKLSKSKRPYVVGTAKPRSLAAGRATKIVVKLTKKANRALRRLRSVKVTVSVLARDTGKLAGPRKTAVITLKR